MISLEKPPLNELIHFGVLGMKWGVRKDNKKSNRRLKMEDKYKTRGMTQKQAEEAADKRLRFEKVLAVTAGVTLVSVSAYLVHKQHVKKYADEIIDKGAIFNRIARSPDGHISKKTFVSILPEDLKSYKDNLTFANDFENKSKTYHVSLKGVNKIVMPSQKMQEKLLLEVMKGDSKYIRNNVIKSRFSQGLSDKAFVKRYYNDLLRYFSDEPLSDTFNSTYAKLLKDKGYNAVIDMNDFLGNWAKKPMILLNALEDVVKVGSEVIR